MIVEAEWGLGIKGVINWSAASTSAGSTGLLGLYWLVIAWELKLFEIEFGDYREIREK